MLQAGLAARRQDAEAETLDAISDHNEIRDAVTEVARHQVGTGEWFAAVAAANLANSDHMAEEEREGLTTSGASPASNRGTIWPSLRRLPGEELRRSARGRQGP